MKNGKIFQSLSGYYDVMSDGILYRTRARGNFRSKEIKPIVGDVVKFDVTNGNQGYVLAVLPRTNQLKRPPVANVDQAIIVASATEPAFSQSLLDKELVVCESQNIKPIIYFSKLDIVKNNTKSSPYFRQLVNEYKAIGYPVLTSLMNTKKVNDELKTAIRQKITVIMGQTGAGKSTLINRLEPDLRLATDTVSKSLSRGKHTTRKVSSYQINNGLVIDTPGFSSFSAMDIEPNELRNYFPEIVKYQTKCKYRVCLHLSEPDCEVKKQVKSGKIAVERYNDYLSQLHDLKNQKPNYKKKRK